MLKYYPTAFQDLSIRLDGFLLIRLNKSWFLTRAADPGLHHFGTLDPDPNRHKSPNLGSCKGLQIEP